MTAGKSHLGLGPLDEKHDFKGFASGGKSPPLDHTERAGQDGGGQGNLGEFGRMDFTRIGFVFAHLFFWYGLFGVAFSVYQGLNWPGFVADQSAATTYLTREIGESMTRVFMGLALGVLCEISSKRSRPDREQA